MQGLVTTAALNDDAEEKVDDARRTLARHRRQRYPHRRSCAWCHEPYPCQHRRLAEHVLAA